jgi:hypothetical protein
LSTERAICPRRNPKSHVHGWRKIHLSDSFIQKG